MLEPMLSDSDPEVGGYAGYLMCLLGDRRGLDPIIHVWQSHRDDDTWRRLAYRAIAVVNDDSLTPTLTDMYGTFQAREYNIRDFYWTIRIMTGPQVLKLASASATKSAWPRCSRSSAKRWGSPGLCDRGISNEG